MRLEDQHRFQLEPGPGRSILLWCTRCGDWEVTITDPLGLDDLDNLADPHTEVCR